MTIAPYVYIFAFGISAIGILLTMDYMERDHQHDDDTNQTREEH